MLHIAFWGVDQVDPDVTSTCHVVTLPNTYRHLHNEYVYHTNSVQRPRGKNLEAKSMIYFFFPVLYRQALHKKCTNF